MIFGAAKGHVLQACPWRLSFGNCWHRRPGRFTYNVFTIARVDMTNSFLMKNRWHRLALLFVVVVVLGCGTIPSRARTQPISINVNNNSGRTITHLYLSPADSDNWGPDLLGDNAIASGSSFTISEAACDQASIKVIAEDQDGCFVSSVVECSGNSTWTITNDAARNCGN